MKPTVLPRPSDSGIKSRVALFALAAALGGCAAPEPPAVSLEDALDRLRAGFETGDADRIRGLYPDGWALVAFPGEPRRSVLGAELRQLMQRMFRQRAPIGYAERPASLRVSEDRARALFVPQWTSMELGTDRPRVERFRIGLTRDEAGPGWRITEFSGWVP